MVESENFENFRLGPEYDHTQMCLFGGRLARLRDLFEPPDGHLIDSSETCTGGWNVIRFNRKRLCNSK